MKLRFSQIKLFTDADLVTLQTAVNAWLVATPGDLVSISLIDRAEAGTTIVGAWDETGGTIDGDAIESSYAILVVYTTE